METHNEFDLAADIWLAADTLFMFTAALLICLVIA